MQGRGIRGYISSALSYVNRFFDSTETNVDDEVELVLPGEHFQENEISTRQIMADYAAFMFASENRVRIFAVAVLTLLGTGMNFLAPYLLGEVISSLGGENNSNAEIDPNADLFRIASLVAVYSLSQLVPNIRDQIMVSVAANNTKKLLQQITTQQLGEKSLQYHIKTSAADKIYVIQKSFAVSSVGTPLLTQVAPTLLEVIIASFLLTRQYGPVIGFGASTSFGLYTAYCALTTKPIIDTKETSLITGSNAWRTVKNSIDHYKTIHDFNKFVHTLAEVEDAVGKAAMAEQSANLVPLRIGLGHIAIPRLGMLLASLYVGNRVQHNQLSIREFVMLFGYLNQLSMMIPGVGQAMNQVFSSYPDLKFVFGELGKPSEIIDAYQDVKLQTDGPAQIEFRNVSFNYPDRPQAFDNLSFAIQPGQTVALVSESGAGKSTLFNLLYGYYQPTSGSIHINGHNITEVSRDSLQDSICMVGQAANLHSGSVRENVVFGARHPALVTDDDIHVLANKLNLGDFIETLDAKLETDVGQDGKAFSGGQQQKVAILRGFFKDAPIRLLDEVTAALDAGSAELVLDGIKQHYLRQSTTLIITHKLKEVTFADKILVLDKGRVLAEGTHDELLESCELYQSLWQKQFDKPIKPGLLTMSMTRGGLFADPDTELDITPTPIIHNRLE